MATMEVTPSTLPGYSWVTMIRGAAVEALSKPVRSDALNEVARAMGWTRAERVISDTPRCHNPRLKHHECSTTGAVCLSPPEVAAESVYFIQAETGPIKIGRSTFPESRLEDFQIGCPVRLRLVGTIPGGCDLETRLHHQFAADHVRGEWFNPSPALLAIIAGAQHG